MYANILIIKPKPAKHGRNKEIHVVVKIWRNINLVFQFKLAGKQLD